MLKKHWTPRYIADRWRLARWRRAHPDAPWLAPHAVEFLEQYLRPTDVLVEFGSGGSTAWFARRVGHVVSIEHNPAWFQKVTAQLAQAGLTNVSYHLVDQPMAPGHPPTNERHENHQLYTDAAEGSLRQRASDARADVILCDGANRDTTAAWALDRVRPGGLVIIDNCNRFLPSGTRAPASLAATAPPLSPLWVEFQSRTSAWRSVWFSDGIADTLVLFAPPA